MFKKFFFIFMVCIFLISCNNHEEYGAIEFYLTHTIDGDSLQWNQLGYRNKAGNQYQLNEVKYFISNLILIDNDGQPVKVTQDAGLHYVDCSLPYTLRWNIGKIPTKHYRAISFVFGLDEADNKSNRFVNPPESNFSWPQALGGGYHYMQINGKFLNSTGEMQNMNIHTGIGQLYDENNDIIDFVHNYFTVTLPVSFSIDAENTTPLTLNMEIQRWFETPNIYDFNEFGTGIMQNQHAQKLLKENGKNVFNLK